MSFCGSAGETETERVLWLQHADLAGSKFCPHTKECLEVDFRIPESEENIKRGLQKLFDSEISKYISGVSLLKVFDRFTDECVQMELQRKEIHKEAISNLLLRKRQLHDKILAYIIKGEKDYFSTFQQESWFVPLISKDMLCHMDDEQEMYRRALVMR